MKLADEDVIEHNPRSVPRVSSLTGRHLGPRVIVGALILLLIGAAVGYLTGQRDEVRMGALPLLWIGQFSPPQPSDAATFESLFGQERPPLLQQTDLEALGEAVQQSGNVVSGRLALPILCDTSVGQPGTSDGEITFPSRYFVLTDASIHELVWTYASGAQAVGALRTLVAQAVSCPHASDASIGATTIATSGLQLGIGWQYAVFTLVPLPVSPETPVAAYLTIVLAQWERHLVEIAFSSTVDVPDALERAERAARAAVALIADG